jgi:hypothetical protein
LSELREFQERCKERIMQRTAEGCDQHIAHEGGEQVGTATLVQAARDRDPVANMVDGSRGNSAVTTSPPPALPTAPLPPAPRTSKLGSPPSSRSTSAGTLSAIARERRGSGSPVR